MVTVGSRSLISKLPEAKPVAWSKSRKVIFAATQAHCVIPDLIRDPTSQYDLRLLFNSRFACVRLRGDEGKVRGCADCLARDRDGS